MSNVQVDAAQVLAMFSEFDEKHRKVVFRRSLGEASRILVRETRKQLRGVRTKSGSLSTKTKSKWTGKTLESGVRYKIAKNAKESKVHIMGDFRLKFFELGTKDRRTKGYRVVGKHWVGGRIYKERKGSGGFRGRIEASKFFAKGKEMSERQVFASMDQIFSKHVEKINAKYK
jgi:hypothetical protein